LQKFKIDDRFFPKILAFCKAFWQKLMSQPMDFLDYCEKHKKKIMFGVVVVGATSWAASRFKVAGPSQYVVRTGLGIKDISVTKKAVQWPFQTVTYISLEPVTFPIEVDAMSAQRIPFRMPSVWTIGPRNDLTALTNYARLFVDKRANGIREAVEGVIQGETRVLTANLDLNKLFSDRDQFKVLVVDKINAVVEPFGLLVYNANIAELTDLDKDNQYFSEQKRRALQRVNQEARVDVAEAIRDGVIGETMHQSSARQGAAKAEMEAKLVEYQRDREVAESLKNLEVAKAVYVRETEVARIQAKAAAEERRWDLQKAVEEKRTQQEIERRRAEEFTIASVQAEVAIKQAEGQALSKIKEAEGQAQATRLGAEAGLYARQMEAQGILALRQAEADGLSRLIASAGDVDGLNRYVMIRDNLLPVLAEQQAKAMQGLNPRISVWNTGSNSTGSNFSQIVGDVFRTGMPLFDGIKQQTGYDFMQSLGVKQTTDTTDSSLKQTDAKFIHSTGVKHSVSDDTTNDSKHAL